MDILSINLGNKAHDVTALQQRARLAALHRAHPGLDIIVTQEALRSPWLVPLGWSGRPIVGGGAEQVRILVRKGTKLLGSGAIRMHEGREHQWPARWLPFVIVPHDGGELCVVDIHLNSGIDAGGKWAAIAARARFTQHHIDALADWADFMRKLGIPCVMLGDTNVDAYADQRVKDPRMLTAQLGRVGMVEALPATKSGTHGDSPRRIDRCFHSRGLSVSVRDLSRVRPYDHQPVLARIR